MAIPSRLRRSTLIELWACVLFVLAGLGFFGILDDNPLTRLAQNYPALELSVRAVQAGGVLALLAVAAGGLPIGWAVLRFGLGQRRPDVLLLAVPLICALVLGVGGASLVIVANLPGAPNSPGVILFFGPVGLFLAAAIASPAAVSAALVRSPVGKDWYRLARLPWAAAVAAMTLTACAMAAGGVSATLEAPQAFHGALGLFGLSTDLSWAGVLAGIALATVVAAVAVARSVAGGSRPTRGTATG